uniref:Uncharacterized protein n=1 Tax=Candidatus Kentrum sp. DK TaxID=2126562 RepID=A0A450T3I3_9GAMM|nr:MAG: hypothetical protein BECKDK2373C_GA0170839_10858 [Candidatus Kentron sp. DK]
MDKRLQGAAEKLAHHREHKYEQITLLQKIDPIYWLSFAFSYFLLTDKYKLNATESNFILTNINKHRRIIWVNVLGGVMVYHGIADSDPAKLSTLISVLIAPAFITGGAWFAITFGGVPEKLLDAALVITFWMFSAFTLSLTTMGITIYFALGGEPLVLSVIAFINFAVILSAVLYDNIDGLKVGLDQALKDNSQANLRYLKQVHDVEPPAEGENIYDNLKKLVPKETSANDQESLDG